MRLSQNQQRTDSLSLEGMVELLREDRFGLTPEPYPTGYEHGFRYYAENSEESLFGSLVKDTRSPEFIHYMKGRRAGRDAYFRGAHDKRVVS